MAANISWKLSFDGVNEQLTQLKKVQDALDNIGKTSKELGSNNYSFSGGRNQSGGGNVIVSQGGSSGAAAGAAAGAAGASSLSPGAAATSKNTTELQKLNLSVKELEKAYRDAYGRNPKSPPIPSGQFTGQMAENWEKKWKNATGSTSTGGLPKGPSKWQFDTSKSWDENQSAYNSSLGSSVPPPLPSLSIPPIIGNDFGSLFSNGLMGTLKTSPNAGKWASFASSFESGGIGGGAGGLAGGILSKITPIGLAITVALGAAAAALKVFKFALNEAIKGLEYGAQAYKNAARYGKTVQGSFGVTSALDALGIQGYDLSILQGQFNNKANRYGIPDSDMVLGAARAGQFGNANELLNMSKEFQYAMADGANNARQMGDAAKANQKLSIEMSTLQREWKTAWAQFVAIITPGLLLLIKLFKFILEQFNMIANLWLKLGQQLAKLLHLDFLLPSGGEDNKFSNLVGSNNNSSTTAWEKMGFIFNGTKPEKHLQEISKNTRDTVNAINSLSKFVGGGGSFGGGGAGGEWPMLPGLP